MIYPILFENESLSKIRAKSTLGISLVVQNGGKVSKRHCLIFYELDPVPGLDFSVEYEIDSGEPLRIMMALEIELPNNSQKEYERSKIRKWCARCSV